MNKNLSIAVHLHLYYLDMWPQIKQYLANLDDYDLFVTMNAENRDIIEEIKKFHPATAFYVVENKGYDVGPFIFFLNRIDLNRYDLILKIHTKSNKNDCNTMLNGRYLNRKYWFRLLVEALIGTKEIFRQNIKAFQKDAEMGMIGSKYCIMSGKKDTAAMKEKVTEVMSELGFPEGEARTFVAGTMFMVRSELLQKVKDKYGIDDFAATDNKVKDGTLAHALERVFGYATEAQGYTIRGYDKNRAFEFYSMLLSLRRFVFQKKITGRNYLQIKIFKLPVYYRKITQED